MQGSLFLSVDRGALYLVLVCLSLNDWLNKWGKVKGQRKQKSFQHISTPKYLPPKAILPTTRDSTVYRGYLQLNGKDCMYRI